ncbi:MAG: TolC family protein [Thermodesulfovibrionales bacterium]|nr:TolC family protein [Thermodesulfovibrionales bacterium]
MRFRKALNLKFLIIFAIIIFSGCSAVGPDYVKPDIKTPSQWQTKLKKDFIDRENQREISKWWENLKDPQLSKLIERAVANNLDLKIAYARVREARARRGVSKANLYPSVDAKGNANLSSENKKGDTTTSELFSASIDANWEFDIFGGLRRSIEASQADFEASQENLRDASISDIRSIIKLY